MKSSVKIGLIFIFLVAVIIVYFCLPGDVQGQEGGKPEPILWSRTSTTETWKNPDRTYTKILYSGTTFIDDKSRRFPVYVPWNSSFFPVINSTYKDYEYELDQTYADYQAYFQDDIKAGKGFRFEVRGYWFTYDLSSGKMQWAVENKSGVLDWGKTKSIGAILSSIPYVYGDNKIRYNTSFLSTDVQYEMILEGVKENFIFKNMLPGYAGFVYLEYTGEIQFNDTLTMWANGAPQAGKAFTTSEAVEFKDEGGSVVFRLPSPIAMDSDGNTANLIYDIKPDKEKLTFGLKVPISFLETATFPIYIDPTVTLQTAGSENVKDAEVSTDDLDINFGTNWYMYAGKPPASGERNAYLEFNISPIINLAYSITSANLSLFCDDTGEILDTSVGTNISAYHVYGHWMAILNGFVNETLGELGITWNNQSCGTAFDNTSNCNTTAYETENITSTGWYGWDVGGAISFENFRNNGNISFALNETTANIGAASFYTKEYNIETSKRPKLTIDYTPYIDIIQPTPAQTFTEDPSGVYFNISNATAVNFCKADIGGANITMSWDTAQNQFWNHTNHTIRDGTHTVKFWCNDSATGRWYESDSVTFDNDPSTVTVCRDLTVAGRQYTLQNSLYSTTEDCITLKTSNNIGFDGNNYEIKVIGDYQCIIVNSEADYFNLTNIVALHKASTPSEDAIHIDGSDGIIYNLNSTENSVQFNCFPIVVDGGRNNLTNLTTYPSSNEVDISIGPNEPIYIFDSIINKGIDVNFVDSYAKLYLINVSTRNTFSEDITIGSITRKWYFDAQANTTGGAAIQNINISLYNSSGELQQGVFADTGANGRIGQQQVIEYINDSGTNQFYFNYTVYANDTVGNYRNQTIGNVYIMNNTFLSFDMREVLQLNVTLLSPSDHTWNTSKTINFTFQPWSNYDFQNCSVWTNDTYWHSSAANATGDIANLTVSQINYTFSADGTYVWNIECYSDGSQNISIANRTINIDSTKPSISSEALNVTYFNGTADVRMTFDLTETNLAQCWATFIKEDAVVYNLSGTHAAGVCTIGLARVDQIGDFSLRPWANDTASNNISGTLKAGVRVNLTLGEDWLQNNLTGNATVNGTVYATRNITKDNSMSAANAVGVSVSLTDRAGWASCTKITTLDVGAGVNEIQEYVINCSTERVGTSYVIDSQQTIINDTIISTKTVNWSYTQNWTLYDTGVGYYNITQNVTIPTQASNVQCFINNVNATGTDRCRVDGTKVTVRSSLTFTYGAAMNATVNFTSPALQITQGSPSQFAAEQDKHTKFERSDTYQNLAPINYTNMVMNISVPRDIEKHNLTITNESGKEVTITEWHVSDGFVLYTHPKINASTEPDHIVEIMLSYNLTKINYTIGNITVGTLNSYYYNISGNITSISNVYAYFNISEDFMSFKLWTNASGAWTDITGSADYSYTTHDQNGNGKTDKVSFYVPTLSTRYFILNGSVGEEINVTEEKTITNKPITQYTNVRWLNNISIMNNNPVSQDFTYKVRPPTDATNFVLDDVGKKMEFDALGGYILIQGTLAGNSQEQHNLTYITPSVTTTEDRILPDIYIVDKRAQISINVSIKNWVSEDIEDVEKSVFIDYGEDVYLCENFTLPCNATNAIDSKYLVSGMFNIEIDEIAADDIKRYTVSYKIPTASKTVSNPYREVINGSIAIIYPLTISSHAPISMRSVEAEIEEIEYGRVSKVQDDVTGVLYHFRSGSIIIELGAMDVSSVIKLKIYMWEAGLIPAEPTEPVPGIWDMLIGWVLIDFGFDIPLLGRVLNAFQVILLGLTAMFIYVAIKFDFRKRLGGIRGPKFEPEEESEGGFELD